METKKCKYCGKKRPIDEYEIANTVKGVEYRRLKCKPCWQADKTKRKNKMREWLSNLKKALSCVKCGESDFRLLDFHHRDQKEKDLEIASVIRRGWSKDHITKEIQKCDILCCKCHRILHWEEKERGVAQPG